MSEMTFFKDPAIDKLMGIVLNLGSEVFMLRSQFRAVEQLLDRQGIVTRADIEALSASDEFRQAMMQESRAFAAHLLGPLAIEERSFVDPKFVPPFGAIEEA